MALRTPAPAGTGSPAPAAAPTAVLFATAPADDGRPAAALAWDEQTTLLERLTGQLRSLGITDVRVLVRPGAGLGDRDGAILSQDAAADLRYVAELSTSGPLIVAAADVVTQREALAGLLADPRLQTGILTTSGKLARPWGYRTRVRRGRLISASSPFHTTAEPNQTFLEVLKVSPADRPRLSALAARLAALRAAPPEEWRLELDHRKAGSWKLAADRAAKAAIAREERLAAEAALASGATLTREEELAIDPEAESDPEATDEPSELERRNPDTVELDAVWAAELERRMAAAREEVPALLLTALIRDGAQVGNSFLRSLFWARPLSPDAVARARERILSYDEEAELLRSAVKASDGFFTTFFVSPLSKYVARAAARAGLGPNQVTVFSMLLGIAAAALFATGERWGLVTGGVVAYFAFFFDCVDGQLARYARKFSKLGAWLDSIFDRSKEYVIFAGLALGAHRMGYEPAWVLACAAITLQTARHAIDFSWPTTQHAVIETLEHQPLDVPGDAFGNNVPLWLRPPPLPREERPPPPPLTPFQRVWRLWRRIGRLPGAKWVKKAITFPIGERFAVIAIVTAVATPKTTLIVLLSWGGFAAAYILLGRLLRVVRTTTLPALPAAARGRLESYRDDGPIVLPPFTSVAPLALLAPALIVLGVAVVVGRGESNAVAPVLLCVLAGAASSGRIATDPLRWLVPPVLRIMEFAAIAWMARLAGHAEAGYAFLAAVCFRQYDLVYRLRHRGTESERLVSVLGLGWGGRMLLVLILLLTGAIPVGLYIAAGLLALLWVSDAVRAWTRGAVRPRRPADDVETDEEEEAG